MRSDVVVFLINKILYFMSSQIHNSYSTKSAFSVVYIYVFVQCICVYLCVQYLFF